MITLCRLLRERFNVYTYIILPRNGNGENLLKDAGIDYQMIKSYDWIVPIDQKRDIRTRIKIAKSFMLNRFAACKIARFAKRENFHLIHINTTYSYVGALAARHAKIPYIWHLREFLEEDQGKTIWNKKKGYRLINKSSKIIAISQSIYNKYYSFFGKEKLRMIYNGIDADIFYEPNKKILENTKTIFIFVGNFAYHKGHLEFVHACVKLAKCGINDFEIWFIGSGNPMIQKEVVKYLQENGLSDNTKMIGYTKNVADYYKKADIAFTCSKSEAFGRITVEAMLSGNLVIGADVAGTKELITHGKTGLLYHQGSSEHLAETMLYALTHKEEMQVIANEGRVSMYETMTAQINAQNIVNVYKEVLSEFSALP